MGKICLFILSSSPIRTSTGSRSPKEHHRRSEPQSRSGDLIEKMAMAMGTAVKPLNGAEEYLRWKESMLLRLHTAGVAHVLSDDPPPPAPASGVKEEDDAGEAAAARRKWARDDAVCRGHILAALSDRVFPDYVRHATARAAWDAVGRTYDVDASRVARRMLIDIQFDADGGGVAPAPRLLEGIAHAEALNAATKLPLSDEELAYMLCGRLPDQVATLAITRGETMDDIWHVARILEARRIGREDEELHGKCESCGQPGHQAGNCMAPLLPVAPLDGRDGYLRWKESMLLRLRTLDIAYVLFEDDKPPHQDAVAAKKWARDDELCRGHILATLSDRLLPDYAHHATAAAAWRALAHTYDLDMRYMSHAKLFAYKFVTGAPVLEQLAHVEALGVGAKLGDSLIYGLVTKKLPPALVEAVILASPPYQEPPSMETSGRLLGRKRGPVCLLKFGRRNKIREEVTTQMTMITGARNEREGPVAGRATIAARWGTSPGNAAHVTSNFGCTRQKERLKDGGLNMFSC
uniref:CCHC-type domain-containing protein n=1 Tax=Leersia perrieri TaxID=77586 RepID=A0A0D9X7W8_9ORYZ